MTALKHHMENWRHNHGDFVMLAVLFTTFRAMTVLYFRPGGYIRDYTDSVYYLGAAGLTDQGLYPFIDYWLEYPPLFPWLTVALYRLSLLVPPWAEDPRLWFNVMLGLILVLFELGNLVLIHAIARRTEKSPSGLRAAVFYAMLFTPVATLTGFFDNIPLFFMLLGLYWLLGQKSWSSGIALGFGFAVKITPAVLIPVAVRALAGWQRRAQHLIGAAVAVIVLSAPFLLLNPGLYLTPFRGALGRSSWETIWALLEGYFGYGAVGGDRFDHNVSDFTIHAGSLPWVWITAGFALVYLWFYTRPLDYRDDQKVLGLSTLTIALFMLYSKGYSPQFLIYLLPFVALCCAHARGVVYVVALTLLNFLEQPVYFVMFPDQHGFYTGLVIFRTVMLAAVTAEGAFILMPPSLSLRRIWSRLVAVLATALAVWVVWSGSGLMHAYKEARFTSEPFRPAMEYLREVADPAGGTGLVFTDTEAYRRIYPYLHSEMDLRVVKTDSPLWEGRLQRWTAAHPRFWLWRGDVTDPDLEAWLDNHTEVVETRSFEWGSLFLLSTVQTE